MAFATDTYIIKGMRQDESDLLFNGNKDGLSFAFENLNMRFTTDTETTSLVATQEKGNTQCTIQVSSQFFMNIEDFTGSFYNMTTLPFIVLGHCEIDKYIVLFGKCVINKTFTNSNGQTLTFSEGNDVILRLELQNNVFYGWLIYNFNELNFNLNWPLETLGNIETNLIKKVYFVDGVNIPRAVNIVNADAGQLSNINLGFNLQLNDVFTVKKENVPGNYPMGKIRFFYTYFNDNFSETNIVDWSPFFDCNYINQGGGPDSQYTTQFAFRVHIDNADTQFKFVRIYFQHFTSNDAIKYQLKYIERPITSNTIDVVIKFDEEDAKDSTETYLDKKLTNYMFIPYTIAEKNNRLFYGNIKKGMPSIKDISFDRWPDITFRHKQIGYMNDGENGEHFTSDAVYQYEPDRLTFRGSNFDYMGFRKYNWYRFGIIAQYKTGEWSDVIFIGDKQCDISSKTEIEYNEPNIHVTEAFGSRPFLTTSTKTNAPLRSVYYIPEAYIVPNTNFINNINKLKRAGFKRFKPVCVVPPKGYRNVITQGLSCATLYRGGDRNKSLLEINSRGLFAIPSYFFRPLPLYPDELLKMSNGVMKPNYSFTIRKVSDLTLSKNIKVGDKWILNPPFDDDLYTNYNSAYREFRHGFSLPPKDTINAELQSSDISICDYFYNVNNSISPLFNPSITSNTNLMKLAWDGRDNVLDVVKSSPYNNQYSNNNTDEYLWRYQVVPQHPLMLTGYNDTMFIDESILTLNSPEVDYDYSSSVSAYYKDCLIEVAGYAQVTSSQVNYDISQTKFNQSDYSDGEHNIDKTAFYNVSGECLFNLVNSDDINALTKTMLFNQQRRILKGGSMLPVCGPWWFDTMLVAAMRPIDDGWSDFSIQPRPSLAIGPPDPIDGANKVFVNSDNVTLNFRTSTPLVRFKTGFNRQNIKYTTSFYGEVNYTLVKTAGNDDEDENNGTIKRQILYTSSSIYPVKKNISQCTSAIFNDFESAYLSTIGRMYPNSQKNIPDYIYNVYKASGFGLTFNTKLLDYLDIDKDNVITNDVYWKNYDEHRQYKPGTMSYITLPSDSASTFMHTDDNFFTIYCLKKQNNNYSIEDHNNNILRSWIRNTSGFDMLGTSSYYFFPYDVNSSNLQINDYVHWFNAVTAAPFYVTHPMTLPQMTQGWHQTNSSHYCLLNNDASIDYFTLNEYGCHYYAPFSTNFLSMLFDPYYAHVVYPFMNTGSVNGETPFCGSSDVYREGNIDKRPKQNTTHSSLYSCCTNYIYDTDLTTLVQNLNTVSAYHCSPAITQILAPEPILNLPYLRNTTLSRVYSFKYSSAADSANVPIITHRTHTLTAATKWYRGFKTLKTPDYETDELVNNGNYITRSTIQGNLLFSGWMPQFISKSGLLRYNVQPASFTEVGLQINSNCYLYLSDSFDNPNDFAIFNDVSNMYIELDYNVAPHIVYYTYQSNNELRLLSDFYMYNANVCDLYNNTYQFKPQYYYKTFRANTVPKIANDDSNILDAVAHLSGIAGWYRSTYPHTGWFEPLRLTPLSYNNKPYWNKDSTLSNYPQTITQNHIEITQDIKQHGLLHHDINGQEIAKQDMFALPISNMYDSRLITEYSTANPYTYENISCEHWNWKMCGPTYNFDSFGGITNRWPSVDYKEGDTYFQRYNCMKTFAKEVETINKTCHNNVSETASVMIESYINIDGLYWEYPSTKGFLESNLINPVFNNQSQINRVYSIQNDICDTFKEIDTRYYNSELTHYPTEILWSAQKQDGETADSWGIVPLTNNMFVSGEMGTINKLISYKDNIYCLQEHGLSILNYNSKVIEPTDTNSTLSLYLSDATKLQDVTYLSRNIGTLNKWSVTLGQYGFYWIDETLQNFYKCGESENGFGIENMSNKYGFKSWSKAHITSDNCLWKANTFINNLKAFKANYDFKSNDIYWANNEFCICFNEILDCFTSFYNYENIPYKFNYLDKCYSIYPELRYTSTMWEDYSKYSHSLYNKNIDSYIELLVNPNGQFDKIFNFIEYYTEVYNPLYQYDTAYASINPYNYIRVNNTYQIGDSVLNAVNTQHKFKLWRTAIPREMKNGKLTMNRIRSPWCKIKLQHKSDKPIILNTLPSNEYRDKLHYINVNYTIPEQPIKTNIRN